MTVSVVRTARAFTCKHCQQQRATGVVICLYTASFCLCIVCSSYLESNLTAALNTRTPQEERDAPR